MDFNTPVEMVRSTKYGNDYYLVYSNKIHRPVQLFSKLEYYNFLSLECDPNVVKFCEQPCKIEVVEDGKIRHAIFDMWVRYRDNSEEMQEVKYSKELAGDDDASIRTQEQIRREQHWCNDNGVNFVIRTEKELMDGKFILQNRSMMAAMLRRYAPSEGTYYDPLIRRFLENADYDRKKVIVGELIHQKLLPVGHEWEHLCYLYGAGVIELDIKNRPMDLRMEVRLCQN